MAGDSPSTSVDAGRAAEVNLNRTGTLPFIQELMKRTFKSFEGVIPEKQGHELTEEYFAKNGFGQPILIKDSSSLDSFIPQVTDYKTLEGYLVPELETADVIDVERQSRLEIDITQFFSYMESTHRTQILNMISLEISNSRLGELVRPPRIVTETDWYHKFARKVRHQPGILTQGTVEKYCLVSPKLSFTDFHIDFSGSSVWYTVVKGEKIFYLIEPSEENLALFYKWVNSGKRLDTFFGDQVANCYEVKVAAGHTLMISAGWIHAVLTTEDTIAYGGNFLNSYNVPLQLLIYEKEIQQRESIKFIYPNFEDINWLAARGLTNRLMEYNDYKYPAPEYLMFALKTLCPTLKKWAPFLDPFRKTYFSPDKLIKDIAQNLRKAEKIMRAHTPPKPERESKRIKRQVDFKDYILFGKPQKRSTTNSESTESSIDTSMSSDELALPRNPLAEMSRESPSPKWQVQQGGMKVVFKKMKNDGISPQLTPDTRDVPEIEERSLDVQEESPLNFDNYQEDADYIYPSVESSDDETSLNDSRKSDDKPWNPSTKSNRYVPKKKKKPTKPTKQGKSMVEKAVEKKIKAINSSLKRRESTNSSSSMTESNFYLNSIPGPSTFNPSTSCNVCVNNRVSTAPVPVSVPTTPKVTKPKKKLTTKQRLCKILKMKKMLR